mgnify:CR=1 FL=1
MTEGRPKISIKPSAPARDPHRPRVRGGPPAKALPGATIAPADLGAFAAAPDKRLLLYRKLVRGGLTKAIAVELPRTAARLEEAFEAWVCRFIEEEAPRSHYLRDVAYGSSGKWQAELGGKREPGYRDRRDSLRSGSARGAACLGRFADEMRNWH